MFSTAIIGTKEAAKAVVAGTPRLVLVSPAACGVQIRTALLPDAAVVVAARALRAIVPDATPIFAAPPVSAVKVEDTRTAWRRIPANGLASPTGPLLGAYVDQVPLFRRDAGRVAAFRDNGAVRVVVSDNEDDARRRALPRPDTQGEVVMPFSAALPLDAAGDEVVTPVRPFLPAM